MPVYLQGLMLGFAMILPIGPQNACVMMQGVRRQYHIMSALICALSDVLLLSAGIFGGSFLLSQSPWLLKLITWGGVVFLLWYGWGAFKAAWYTRVIDGFNAIPQYNRQKIIIMLLAVTWLNPHVYLDTIVVLGSIGSQFSGSDKQLFALGAISASFIWFFSLALLAAKFAKWLQKPVAQMIINILIGLVMWVIAWQLATNAIN